MTQHYAPFTTKLYSLFGLTTIVVMACTYQHKIASARAPLALVFALFTAMTASQQAVAHNTSNTIFKAQASFENYYLAYASSQGIGGGGGGGGHGCLTRSSMLFNKANEKSKTLYINNSNRITKQKSLFN